MSEDAILYISDHDARSRSIIAALEAAGYDVASTGGSTQAIALLFVMHSVTAVVVEDRSIQQSSFDLPHSLRALRPDVPIILLCANRIDHLPSEVGYCVDIRQPLEHVTADLQRLLAEKPAATALVDSCNCVRREHIVTSSVMTLSREERENR